MFAKIFERKWVIRFFGMALILAPFFNTATSVLEIPNIDKNFLLAYCWQYFKSAPPAHQALQIASVIIGMFKLRGSVSAWKFTLALLGGYIILQFTQLNSGERDNTTWMFLATNVALFFFVADQIVLKPRPKQPQVVAKPTESNSPEAKPVAQAEMAETPKIVEVPTPNGSVFVPEAPTQPQNNVTPITSLESAKKVYVNFEGFGNWATVLDVSDSGIKVRAIAPAPPEITSRTLELSLGFSTFRLKFHQQDGTEYSFNFVALSVSDKQSLNHWLLTAAA